MFKIFFINSEGNSVMIIEELIKAHERQLSVKPMFR